TFSDIANAISIDYSFWLGDAFASGGSKGYDHKKEGITAKGAWECVRLHFKERGKNVQADPTTVLGIGDMSGDVFGNGMLLSQTILLRAAFNHLHIFLDPNPHPVKSWKERLRLFKLQRSSWTDYAPKALSKGGGIYERKAKALTVSKEVQQMLGLKKETLTSEALIHAILKMKVDLLWFGGIGTYIKATSESHLQVGDQANDAIRINASECQAQVMGEGANLGVTQLARIELDKGGVQLNSDAIDNSAGVNMSDYEVNIKILLKRLCELNIIRDEGSRDRVLSQATQEVSALVLENNRGQHRLISMDCLRSKRDFSFIKDLINTLVSEELLSLESERIPDQTELEKMEHAGDQMPRSILAILQAYVKMIVYGELSQCALLKDDALSHYFQSYFPKSILKSYEKHLFQHQLKTEIIATAVTNRVLNQAGVTFYHQMKCISARSVEDITRVYLIFDASLKGDSFRNEVLMGNMNESDKYLALLEYENILKNLCENCLQMKNLDISFSSIERYSTLFEKLGVSILNSKPEMVEGISDVWRQKGFSKKLSSQISIQSLMGVAPDVIYLVEKDKMLLSMALKFTLLIDDIFGFEWLKQQIQMMDTQTDWQLTNRNILVQSLYFHKYNVMRFILRKLNKSTSKSISLKVIMNPLNDHYGTALEVYSRTLKELKSHGSITMTMLNVIINQLNFVEFK
ncbi:MAG: NAD-glutamate dehydrogenase, partial [Candidatus Margulisbacteria bacterium]|nr:NAD-glutamate dehydrogenase [Candidatus Margulisiibacteriota bacterium]